MRLTKEKTRCKTYKIKIYFVDDTYWDDGSRFTSRTLHFKTEAEMIAQGAKFLGNPVWFGEGQSGTKEFQLSSFVAEVSNITTTSETYDF